MYKLTIFTCSYNQPKLLVRAMDSVPRHSNIEYIVIDDGSTDETPDVVMKYMDTHPELNMVFVRNRKNYGLGHGKNIAYSLAQGEYIYQLDHDDYILPSLVLRFTYTMSVPSNSCITSTNGSGRM